MRIVFGHNSYVVKRIKPKELGITGNLENDEVTEIQLRQKYGHLYFIPVFPLGQVWVAKKNNGKLYDVHEGLKHKLRQQHSSGVHWGAFALPILILAGLLIYFVAEKINDIQRESNQKEAILTEGINLTKQLDTLTNKNTFIQFSDYDSEYNYYTKKGDLVYRVLKTDKNKVFLESVIKSSSNDSLSRYNFPDAISNYIIYKNSKPKDSIWVDKTQLKKAIKKENPFELVAIEGFPSKMKVYKIFVIDDAYFQENTNPEANTEFYKEYTNYGLDVILDSIIPKVKKEEWKLSKEKNIPFGAKFAIKTDSENNATLYYHSAQKGIKNHVTVYRTRISNKYDEENNNYN